MLTRLTLAELDAQAQEQFTKDGIGVLSFTCSEHVNKPCFVHYCNGSLTITCASAGCRNAPVVLELLPKNREDA